MGDEKNEWSTKTITLLVASCVMGLGMSVATMWIREALSATSVSVVAACNKFISELVNWFIWNKHTTSDGLWAVLIIMVCGIFYEQAPLRVPGQGLRQGGNLSLPAQVVARVYAQGEENRWRSIRRHLNGKEGVLRRGASVPSGFDGSPVETVRRYFHGIDNKLS